MRRYWLSSLVLIAPVLLVGCVQQVPPLNFSVPNVGLSEHRIDAEVRSLTVSLGRPDEQVGAIDHAAIEDPSWGRPTSGVDITTVWKTSLEEAFNRALIFRDDAEKKISIGVTILKLDVPGFGVDFTTHAVARYEIIDRAHGDLIFTQDIASQGTTPASHAFLGIIRARESVNRAVQNNIALFLQAVETIDLERPMFPAQSQVPAQSENKNPRPHRLTTALRLVAPALSGEPPGQGGSAYER